MVETREDAGAKRRVPKNLPPLRRHMKQNYRDSGTLSSLALLGILNDIPAVKEDVLENGVATQ